MWIRWDDQCAIYHRPSGQTHFVNLSTEHLLAVVLRSPAGLEDIVQALNGLPGAQDAPLAPQQVVSLLMRLDELGLIERVGVAGND